ncbi:hypothetical protein PCANC_23920 [Puccinia coronata f. sp. avenae]|uniref:Uncharacterized protein n=1 Tax=Puccinia coronata f. sp. avenae TaxID=200324 RepID=A0A2N5U7A8_9BASI|nr:hypothetical protein PCANC_23920 [Puccinia coronata f. sp. avenae]
MANASGNWQPDSPATPRTPLVASCLFKGTPGALVTPTPQTCLSLGPEEPCDCHTYVCSAMICALAGRSWAQPAFTQQLPRPPPHNRQTFLPASVLVIMSGIEPVSS